VAAPSTSFSAVVLGKVWQRLCSHTTQLVRQLCGAASTTVVWRPLSGRALLSHSWTVAIPEARGHQSGQRPKAWQCQPPSRWRWSATVDS
jgi:hypothetical protein